MNILITSVGRRSYIVEYFKEVLGNKGHVYVSNSTDISPAFNCAYKSVVTPLIYSQDYIPFLLNYCKENDIKLIISLFDVDLYILSLNKTKFQEIGVNVIVSHKDFIKKCNDKWLTYHYLKNKGFDVPRTYLNLSIALNDIKNNVINYPVIIKPRWGMGSLSIYTANNEEELVVLYKKIKNEIMQSYIKYESKDNIDESVVIQEKIFGQEYGLDIINDLNGKYVNTICKEKISMRAGETDCAKIVDNKDLFDIGTKLGKITHHIANLDVDIICNNGKFYILEMNARFGGGYPFSHLAGVNLPRAIVDWSCGKKVDKELLCYDQKITAHKDISIIKLN